MFSLLTILAIGFVLGIRHATDPDHVIAVSTIVTRERKLLRAAAVGVAWGVGHTLTILAVGSALIFLRVTMPPRLGLSMELAVGLMLILLGIRNLRATFMPAPPERHSKNEGIYYHAHGDYVHAHVTRAGQHHPHTTEQTSLAKLDRFFASHTWYGMVRPLVIGIVHGLAGSAAIALLVLSTIRSAQWAAAYLLIFGLGTVLGMVVITIAMSSTISLGQKHFAHIGRHFETAAGLVSFVFGVVITYHIGFGLGLFTGNPTWVPH